jgi:outer membrane protein assembly factor BamB
VTQELVDAVEGWADGAWSARPWAGGSVVDGVWLGGLSEVDYSGGHPIELDSFDVVDGREPVAVRPTRLHLAVAVAVICLIVLSGASAMGPPDVRLLWTVSLADPGQLFAGDDSVYIAPMGSAPTVTALDAQTGARRWRVDVPWTAQGFIDLGDGLDAVVVRTTTVDSAEPFRDEQTLFVRRRDGRVVAQANGAPVQRLGSLVLQVGSVRRCPLDASQQCTVVAAVDPTNGATGWQTTLPPGGRVLADGLGAPDRFATAAADGALSLHSSTTGQVLATVPGTLTGGGGIRLSTLASGTLVIGVAGTETSTFTGYRAATLAPLWQTTLARDSGSRQVDTSLVSLTRCGDLACVGDGGGTAVLDPATGALRFRTRLQVVGQVAHGVLLAVPYLGHLDSLGHYVSDVLALDPVTGTVRLTVADAGLLGSGSGSGQVLVRRIGADHSDIASVAPDGSGRLRTSVPGADLVCAQQADRLLCLDDGGILRAWQLTD